MLNRLHIRGKLLLLLFLANLIFTLAFALHDYYTTRKAVIEGINSDIEATAYGAYNIFPENFYEKIENKASVSKKEFKKFMYILSNYAKKTDAKYIYSMMKFGNDIYFILSTEEEDFFNIYDTAPEALKQTFLDGERRIVDYTDEYGAFRSVFIPFETQGGKRYVIGVDVPAEFMSDRLTTALLHTFLIGTVIFVVFFIIEYVVITRIVRPLVKLTVSTKKLVEADFNWSEEIQTEIKKMTESRKDEVGDLAGTMSYMHTMLSEYIVKLKETTAEKERTEKEIAIARDIQMGILPQTFPAFPGHKDFDLHAIIEPSRIVGGDLYDYILLDDERLFFMIGDVSDKGIAAALFMAITKTLFRTHVLSKNFGTLSELVSMINYQLSQNNPSLMFVTVYSGILNLKTGVIEYVDAGHEPPFILRAESGVEMLQKREGLAICFDENYVYTSYRIQLKPGDGIVLYTDGLTDAMNEKGERLHVEGNLRTLQKYFKDAPPESINKELFKSTKNFVGNAEQFDDIAILTIRYYGEV
ncbi:MAG: hypothetical protein A2Y97_06900 [Nitrospirae bacterium RBG_13_39_12]|nr:MAG: hypothetical protein A2Y97_06900 [Nitrospirae bacterium RBG_13_39_12]